ncbi:MAG: TrmH family RNA methyltransferase, partial [Alphaproteobacteria bacterium]
MGSKKGQLVFGKHSVIAALYNERRQHDQLMLTPETKQEFEHILRDFPGLRVQVLDRRGLSQIVGVDAVHQGCVLRTSAIEQPVIEDIINAAGENDCVIILDQVTDPHNVGAILRTCAAFGVSAVIQQERHGPEPSNPTLGKTAAGSMEHTPIISVTNIVVDKQAKPDGFDIFGTAWRTLFQRFEN